MFEVGDGVTGGGSGATVFGAGVDKHICASATCQGIFFLTPLSGCHPLFYPLRCYFYHPC
jgi:hypothetical protein